MSKFREKGYHEEEIDAFLQMCDLSPQRCADGRPGARSPTARKIVMDDVEKIEPAPTWGCEPP